MHFRHFFASSCLLAVAAEAQARHHYNLEQTLLDRMVPNRVASRPDVIPNWMRGFYDDFTPQARAVPAHTAPVHAPAHATVLHAPPTDFYESVADAYYPAHSPEVEAYELSHGSRDIGQIHPGHADAIHYDPYQRGKAHIKRYAEPHELQRHERGAFPSQQHPRQFTMHPKKPQYRSEDEQKQFEHAQNFYEKELERRAYSTKSRYETETTRGKDFSPPVYHVVHDDYLPPKKPTAIEKAGRRPTPVVQTYTFDHYQGQQ